MIIVIEPFGKANTHIPLVKSLLTFLSGHTSGRIMFISNSDFFDSLPFELRSNLDHVSVVRSRYLLLQIIGLVILLIRVVWKYRTVRKLRIFLLYSTSISSFILKVFSPLFSSKKRKIYVFLHGGLQNVKLKGGIMRRIDGFIQLSTYCLDYFLINSLRFVTISEYVSIELSKINRRIFSNIIGIDFPYSYDKHLPSAVNNHANIFIVSTVGVNSIEKNSQLLNEVAKGLETEILDGIICLKTSSRNDNVVFSSLIKQAELGENYLLPWEDYAKHLSCSDLLIFFNNEDYNLISSSSYFDCINFQKPIIALRNRQWEYNFQKFGKIGFLCSDVEEMIVIIREILEKRIDIYQFDFQASFERTSVDNSFKYLSKKFDLDS